jgi:hypothetical protein
MFAKDCLVLPEAETAKPLADVHGRAPHLLSVVESCPAGTLAKGVA